MLRSFKTTINVFCFPLLLTKRTNNTFNTNTQKTTPSWFSRLINRSLAEFTTTNTLIPPLAMHNFSINRTDCPHTDNDVLLHTAESGGGHTTLALMLIKNKANRRFALVRGIRKPPLIIIPYRPQEEQYLDLTQKSSCYKENISHLRKRSYKPSLNQKPVCFSHPMHLELIPRLQMLFICLLSENTAVDGCARIKGETIAD